MRIVGTWFANIPIYLKRFLEIIDQITAALVTRACHRELVFLLKFKLFDENCISGWINLQTPTFQRRKTTPIELWLPCYVGSIHRMKINVRRVKVLCVCARVCVWREVGVARHKRDSLSKRPQCHWQMWILSAEIDCHQLCVAQIHTQKIRSKKWKPLIRHFSCDRT